MVRPIHIQAAVLNTAESGLELAERVAQSLSRGESVRLDFKDFDRATPSFSNAFMMTLLHQFDRDLLRSNIQFENACPAIIASLDASIRRYDAGIRLSSQRTSAAS